jgi:hypothetical protein
MEKPIFMYADSFGDFVWWVSYWLLVGFQSMSGGKSNAAMSSEAPQ